MLSDIDLSKKMKNDEYLRELAELQLRLLRLQLKMRQRKIPMVIMYEGWDASGKGGSIMRITEKMDPRNVRVWPISAPDIIEQRYHYLWRFWQRMPANDEIAIFDRSWYGRVLVERVEKLIPHKDWQNAYQEIREFESSLLANGMVLLKFWLHISPEEQLKRFHERENDPYKQWKISKDDWRNRDKWREYEEAANDMLYETDRPNSPWYLIPAEDKHYARIATARIVADNMEKSVADK